MRPATCLALALALLVAGCAAAGQQPDLPAEAAEPEGPAAVTMAQAAKGPSRAASSEATAAADATSWAIPAQGSQSLVARWRLESPFECNLRTNTTAALSPGATHIHLLEVYADGELYFVGDFTWPMGRAGQVHAGPVHSAPAYDAAMAALQPVVAVVAADAQNHSYADITFGLTAQGKGPALDIVYTVGGVDLLPVDGASLRIEADCGAPATWQASRQQVVWFSGDGNETAGLRMGLNFLGATVASANALDARHAGRLVARQYDGVALVDARTPEGSQSLRMGAYPNPSYLAMDGKAGTYGVDATGAGSDLMVLLQDLEPIASPDQWKPHTA